MLKNYVRENIQPCSYDFRLGELWKHKKGGVIDLSRDKLPALVALKLIELNVHHESNEYSKFSYDEFLYFFPAEKVFLEVTVYPYDTVLGGHNPTKYQAICRMEVFGYDNQCYVKSVKKTIETVMSHLISTFKNISISHSTRKPTGGKLS